MKTIKEIHEEISFYEVIYKPVSSSEWFPDPKTEREIDNFIFWPLLRREENFAISNYLKGKHEK